MVPATTTGRIDHGLASQDSFRQERGPTRNRQRHYGTIIVAGSLHGPGSPLPMPRARFGQNLIRGKNDEEREGISEFSACGGRLGD
jgi:hypothetical protein